MLFNGEKKEASARREGSGSGPRTHAVAAVAHGDPGTLAALVPAQRQKRV